MRFSQKIRKKAKKQLFSQPKAFWVLSTMEAFESFSFYGLSSLIILFMIKNLGFSEISSIGIFALFMVMTEFLSLMGGFLADRLFGMVHCLKVGGYLMLMGYLLIPFLPENLFLLGLGFIIIGKGLFSSNTTALFGLFYGKNNDNQRDAGFTFYYASLNVGAFFSLILCGLVAEKYGWMCGLALPALGMIGVMFCLYKYENVLSEKDIIPSSPLKIKKLTNSLLFLSPFLLGISLYNYNFLNIIIPLIFGISILYFLKEFSKCSKQERGNIVRILFLAVLLMLFFGVSEQVRCSLVLFAGRHVDIDVFGWPIPLSSVTALNPIIIILISPILSLYVTSNSYKKGLKNILGGFLLMFLVFSYLLLLTYYSAHIKLVHLFIVMGGIAFAELLVGPVIYSLCSTLSPKHFKASMMGIVTIGYAAANHLAGHLANLMAVKENVFAEISMKVYRDGFKFILIILGLSFLATLIGVWATNKKVLADT